MNGRYIRLPGYEFVSVRWMKATPSSRAEAVWYWLRCHLRVGTGKCLFTTNGGMHCSKRYSHDGPHSFTNREWKRTRAAQVDGSARGYPPTRDLQRDWAPGDPCGACGSTDTHWGDIVEGAFCNGCGASDGDES